MCGLAGIFAPAGIDLDSLSSMSRTLAHRGPDGFGYVLWESAAGPATIVHNGPLPKGDRATLGIAHRRLAILDPTSASLQPFQSTCGKYILNFNGEIYNFLDLRKELEELGHEFVTQGDSEVVLKAYQAWGTDCQSRFNGMWAFAILDLKRRELFLSRDRLGIKPLYVRFRSECFAFASEAKALRGVVTSNWAPDESTVSKFLVGTRVDDSLNTFYEGVSHFPAGHQCRIRLDDRPQYQPVPYWSLSISLQQSSCRQTAVDRLRGLLMDSVRIRLQSDRDIGTSLSGGIDSSSILGAATQRAGTGFKVFGYRSEDAFDEGAMMREASTANKAQLTEVTLDFEMFQRTLDLLLEGHGEPFGSASIAAQWAVYQKAGSNGVRVMLDGQGADEVFAGYTHYWPVVAYRRALAGDWSGYRALRDAFPGRWPGAPILDYLLWTWPSLGPKIEPYLRWVYKRHHGDALTSKLLERTTLADLRGGPPSLGQRLRGDVLSNSLPGLLRYADRSSMSHGVEARLPFLDHRIVEFAFALPDHWKIEGNRSKSILRDAVEGLVPTRVLQRTDKIGFKPHPGLTLGLLKKRRAEFLENRTELEHRWFRPAGVEKLFERAEQAEFQVWRLLNVKLWARANWPS